MSRWRLSRTRLRPEASVLASGTFGQKLVCTRGGRWLAPCCARRVANLLSASSPSPPEGQCRQTEGHRPSRGHLSIDAPRDVVTPLGSYLLSPTGASGAFRTAIRVQHRRGERLKEPGDYHFARYCTPAT